MSRFDDLRSAYDEWDRRHEEWKRLGRVVPAQFRDSFIAYLGAPPTNVKTRTPTKGAYVDLYRLPNPNALVTEYERIHPFTAAQENDDGRWEFVVGVVIDRKEGDLSNLHLFIPIDFGRNADSLNFRLTREPGREFVVNLAGPEPFGEIFDRIYDILLSLLQSPISPQARAPIGFSVGPRNGKPGT